MLTAEMTAQPVRSPQAAESDLERTHLFYDAWNRGDIAEIQEFFHADAELRPYLGAMIGKGHLRGHEGVREWFEGLRETWSGRFRLEPERFIEAGDRVLVIVRLIAATGDGGGEIDAVVGNFWWFRDGRVARFEAGDAEEALAEVEAADS
jgi:ketosteroid isomerase-like protein